MQYVHVWTSQRVNKCYIKKLKTKVIEKITFIHVWKQTDQLCRTDWTKSYSFFGGISMTFLPPEHGLWHLLVGGVNLLSRTSFITPLHRENLEGQSYFCLWFSQAEVVYFRVLCSKLWCVCFPKGDRKLPIVFNQDMNKNINASDKLHLQEVLPSSNLLEAGQSFSNLIPQLSTQKYPLYYRPLPTSLCLSSGTVAFPALWVVFSNGLHHRERDTYFLCLSKC